MDHPIDLRIVLLGKTGSGKSATRNTILLFETDDSTDSATKFCQKENVDVGGRIISVTDTPGLFDTSMTEDELKPLIEKCMEFSAPGPHVFLLVIRLDVRFTEEEKNTIKWIQEKFGEDAAKYTIILFTHADVLKERIKVTDLLNLIDEMVKGNKGNYYSNEMYKEVQKKMKWENVTQKTVEYGKTALTLIGGAAAHRQMFQDL